MNRYPTHDRVVAHHREQEDAKILADELEQMGGDEQELAGPWGWDISNDDFEDIAVADDADDFTDLDHMPADDELIAGIASADMQVSMGHPCWSRLVLVLVQATQAHHLPALASTQHVS